MRSPTPWRRSVINIMLNRQLFIAISVCCAIASGAAAPSTDDGFLWDAPYRIQKGWQPLLDGKDLQGWHSQAGWRGDEKRLTEWFTTSDVTWSRIYTPMALTAKRTGGPIIINGDNSHTSNLITDKKFGDMELYLEFMVAKGSNSGVYLHGLYEVQVFDSYAVNNPLTTGDAGAIYERWDNGRGYGGSAPLLNASRPPGEWQFYHIWFRGPRFDSTGHKTENARFIRVVYNGLVVQNNFEIDGPTRSALEIPEAAINPIMLQGDHGPVAFRNIYVKPLE